MARTRERARRCTPARHAQILQKDKKFTPHILPVCLGTTVSFPNLDPIFHNAFSNFNGKVFDIGLHPPGSSPSTKFDRPGIVRVFCNIHHSMSAVIVVLDTPYFAETDKRGKYSIPDVPAGEYQLHAFHERTTPENLARLTRKVSVEQQAVEEPLIAISETGYLPVPHKNKYGREYAIRNDEDRPGTQCLLNERLPKTRFPALADSAFNIDRADRGICNHGLDGSEIRGPRQRAQPRRGSRTSLHAYQSLWGTRTHTLGTVSRIISSMSDVRAAFMTRDGATIRDTAQELWSQISEQDAVFLVLDPRGASSPPSAAIIPTSRLMISRYNRRFNAFRAKFPVTLRDDRIFITWC